MSGLTGPLAAAIGVYVLIALVMFGCQRSLLYFPDKTASEPGQPGVQVVKLLSEPDLELVHLYHPPRAPNGPVVASANTPLPSFRNSLLASPGELER